jgi:hypothetical protein
MMPEADESFTSAAGLTLPVGSSIDYADERVRRVEEVLRDFNEIDRDRHDRRHRPGQEHRAGSI